MAKSGWLVAIIEDKEEKECVVPSALGERCITHIGWMLKNTKYLVKFRQTHGLNIKIKFIFHPNIIKSMES